jgi:hypothetical protein
MPSGSGITVNSTTITDATHATANITIASGADPTARDVNVTTGDETPDLLSGGFTVKAPANGCGAGAGAAIPAFGLMLGLMSLFGAGGLKRKLKERLF